MALTAQNCTPDLWLEGYVIVFTAIVANDLEAFRGTVAFGSFLRATFCATLWRHHVALVKDLLFLLGEKEGVFTLNARCFDVRHTRSS